jgi:hypothetical protein
MPMTHLERLIKAHTEATSVATLSAATERFAEELAREWLKDPAVRAEVQALVREHFAGTMRALQRNGSKPRKKRRKG